MAGNADQAGKALNAMATASMTIREAISKSLPVATTQLMTVQVPGTVLDPNEFFWDTLTTPFTPLNVRIAEAKLVDNMVPVSKIMMGRSGKSVARSYLASLDYLIPVDAAISSAIADPSKPLTPMQTKIKTRYDTAMKYLTSEDERAKGASKLTTYVGKQDRWNAAVENYSTAQERQLNIIKAEGLTVDGQRQKYLEWVQAHARDYKAAIQARYMDWVVHGYKFEVEFNFGVVDISSGMKRIENSKEAFRNLTLIAADGASEFSGVNLQPQNWATLIKDLYDTWATRNNGPTAFEIRAEIKRLKRVLVSHQGLKSAVESGNYLPKIVQSPGSAEADARLQTAYQNTYKAQDNDIKQRKATGQTARTGGAGGQAPAQPQQSAESVQAYRDLAAAQKAWGDASLEGNQATNEANAGAILAETKTYIDSRISQLQGEIKDLEDQLSAVQKKTGASMPAAIAADGSFIDAEELKKDSSLAGGAVQVKPSPFTKITAKVSQSNSESTKVASSSSSSASVQASFGLFHGSGGASYSQAKENASSSMANLDVEISMECMLVEIERPWLHAELFADHELDCPPSFAISPGPMELQRMVENNQAVDGPYTQFCSYPNAFVVACNVELEFSGDTTHLETAMESSTVEANVSVGYGPFAVSASHKQSKSKSSSKCESTATGMKISMQAPQIIAWVQELLPKLPKDQNSPDSLGGVMLSQSMITTASGPPSAPAAAAGGASAAPSGSGSGSGSGAAPAS